MDPDDNGARPADTISAIEDAVAGLDELDTLPVAEHVARFDAVHVALNVALSTVDSPH
jgi:hypothetical protein